MTGYVAMSVDGKQKGGLNECAFTIELLTFAALVILDPQLEQRGK